MNDIETISIELSKYDIKRLLNNWIVEKEAKIGRKKLFIHLGTKEEKND